MADAHHRGAGQVAVCDVLVELARPFVVAPQIRVVLVVSAEVDVGHSSDRRVKWANLDLSSPEGIRDLVGRSSDTSVSSGRGGAALADLADVVHQETVVADGTA